MRPEEVISAIIKEQSYIIGENLAKQMAEDSGVVHFKSSNIEDITLSTNDSKTAIERIVSSYSDLFGQVSVDVCVDVMRKFPHDSLLSILPESLRRHFI